MIHHLDSIKLLSVLIERDCALHVKSKRYMLRKLGNTAYLVEGELEDVIFDLEDTALQRLNSISGETIQVSNQSVYVPDMQEDALRNVVAKHKPSKEIAELILKYHV